MLDDKVPTFSNGWQWTGPLLAALAMAACSGPPIRTAKPQAPAIAPSWRTEVNATEKLTADWWRGFGDPVLSALVQTALSENDDIGIAAGRVREARANSQLAQAQLMPSVDASLAAGRSRSVSAFGTPLLQTFEQPQIQVSYEADLFGRLADSNEAAHKIYMASVAARETVRLSIAAAIATNYVNLLSLDARVSIARDTLTVRADALRVAKSRALQGYSTALELQQAQAEFDATAQIVPQLELGITLSENALQTLLGHEPGPISPRGQLARLAVPALPEGLPMDLLRRRPDISQSEYQLAASDAALAAQRKRFLPQVRLSTSVGRAFSTILTDPIAVWSIGGSVLAPLFEGGRLNAQAEASAGQRDQAAFAYRRTVISALRDTEDALASVQRIDEQAQSAARQRDALRSALRLATNRYREGYSPYLEQLDAQRGLLAAQLGLVQIQASSYQARVQLFQAMGGGWDGDAAEALSSP